MKHFFFILLTVCLASCVMIEPKTPSENLEFAPISYSVNWPDGVLPQDTVCIAVFEANTGDEPVRYFHTLDSQGDYLPQGASNPVIAFGNYVYLACSGDASTIRFEGLSEFISTPDTLIENISAHILPLSDEELEPLKPLGAKDFNSDIPYISQPEALCYSIGKCQISDTLERKLALNLNSLVLSLTVNVKIVTEDGVSLTDVVGEISGIPSSISLFNGAVKQNELGRVIFRMEPSADTYSASFNTLGIFPPLSPNHYTGVGILRLRVSADFETGTKYLYPAINLYDLIVSSNIMSPSQNGLGYKISTNYATFDIPATLVIGKGSFSTDGDGVDLWFDSEETFEVEV